LIRIASVLLLFLIVSSAHALSPAVSAMVLTKDGCQYIPGTSTPVGAACLSRLSYPVLKNAVDPINSGADPAGIIDSCPAFQTAINFNKDVYIGTPGTYLFVCASTNAGRGVETNGVNPQNIVCAPGVTLKDARKNLIGASGIFFFQGNNVTIAGCDFQGINVGVGAKPLALSGEANTLVYIADSSNVIVEGNTFENTVSNSAAQFASGSTGPGVTGSQFKYNTCSGNPYYCMSVTSGGSTTVSNNLSIDGNIGVEDDACISGPQPIGTITVANNMISTRYGDCFVVTPGFCTTNTIFLTGGDSPASCNYSTDVVKNNYIYGNSSIPGLITDNCPSCTAAQYTNNVNGPFSTCTSGALHC
jgi:hypothetical protein